MTGKAQETAIAARSATEDATIGAAKDAAAKDAAQLTADVDAAGSASASAASEQPSASPKFNLPMPARVKAAEKSESEKPRAGAGVPAPQQSQRPLPTPKAPPANDDKRTIGELRQSLNIVPNRTIPLLTSLSIMAWAVLWVAFVYFNRDSIVDESGSLIAPKPVLALISLFGPILFFFVTGLLARRAHEMRQIAKSMTEVAIRLIEPESVAAEQVTTLSQAIRRESASMSDGIERALARAGELEVIVRTEITNLERSYSENERRIRALIDELAREREAIVVNADSARTALYGARDQLAQEFSAASATLAEQVSEAGNRVVSALGAKGEELKISLARAGDDAVHHIGFTTDHIATQLSSGVNEIDERLGARGVALIDDFGARNAAILEQISGINEQLRNSLDEAARVVADRFASGAADVDGRLTTASAAIIDTFGTRHADLVEQIDQLTARLTHSLDHATRQVGDRFAIGVVDVDSKLQATGAALLQDFGSRHESLVEQIDLVGTRLAHSAYEASERFASSVADVDGKLQATGSALIETFGSRHEGLVGQIDQIGARLARSIDEASERFASNVADVDDKLQATGSALIETFGSRHEGLVGQIDRMGTHLTRSIDEASERFASGVIEVDSKLRATGSALIETFGSHHEGVVEQIDQIGARLTHTLDEATREVSERFATGVADVDSRLQATGSALIDNFGARHEGLVEQIDQVGARLTQSIDEANERFANGVADVDGRLQATGSALIETFGSRHEGLVEQIDQIGARLTHSLDGATREVGERFATGLADVDSRLQATGSALIDDFGSRHEGSRRADRPDRRAPDALP